MSLDFLSQNKQMVWSSSVVTIDPRGIVVADFTLDVSELASLSFLASQALNVSLCFFDTKWVLKEFSLAKDLLQSNFEY